MSDNQTTTPWSALIEVGEDIPIWLLEYDRGAIVGTFRTRCKITLRDDGVFVVNPVEPIDDCMMRFETVPSGGDIHVKGLGTRVLFEVDVVQP